MKHKATLFQAKKLFTTSYLSKILLLVIAASSILSSCQPEKKLEEELPTTVEQDKEHIKSSFNRIKNIIQDIRESENFNLLVEKSKDYDYVFVGKSLGSYTYDNYEYVYVGQGKGDFNRNVLWQASGFLQLISSDLMNKLNEHLFAQGLNEDFANNPNFDMSPYRGKYIWNHKTQSFDKEDYGYLLAVFPEEKNSPKNNCEIGIEAAQLKQTIQDGMKLLSPIKLKAYFQKDNARMITADFTGQYTENGIPTHISFDVFVKPFTIKTELKQEEANSYSIFTRLSDANKTENNLQIECKVTASQDIDSQKSLSDIFGFNISKGIKNLSFTIRQEKLSLLGDIDTETLFKNEDNINAEVLNNCLNLKLLYNEKEIAQLFIKEIDKNLTVFIRYKDNSNENSEIYYKELVDLFKKLFITA